jgi:hypothetical protein
VRNDGDEWWQRGNDDADRRRDDHEGRTARLEPDSILESVSESGVVHHHRGLRRIAYDGATVRIEMIMTVSGIVMLMIRRELRFSAMLFPALGKHVRRTETGGEKGGNPEARQSHGSSPLPGGESIRARLPMTGINHQRGSAPFG